MTIVMSTRIQDDFSSMGLTSLHWVGPQVDCSGLRTVGPVF
jgi:hypothetical protein